MLNRHMRISDEVRKALETGAPVIALESTIISHGMPYPENVETAINCERIARENGAVPATCSIIGGKLTVGMTGGQIDRLGRAGHAIPKASRRDIPILVARGQDGATTVAATMILSAMAGVEVFGTGGIGGVHRGAQTSMDVSADLDELGATPVTVVCAGAKSILDIPLTLEYLETRGVPVIGYGTDELPAFYTSQSGYKVDYRMDTPQEIALLIRTRRELGYKGGMVVANPIPQAYSMDADYIGRVIEGALEEAARTGVAGKAVTPFLLARVSEATGGKSLAANIQLVYNNIALAARIAAAAR